MNPLVIILRGVYTKSYGSMRTNRMKVKTKFKWRATTGLLILQNNIDHTRVGKMIIQNTEIYLIADTVDVEYDMGYNIIVVDDEWEYPPSECGAASAYRRYTIPRALLQNRYQHTSANVRSIITLATMAARAPHT